ncbi:MAG: MFS transporter [Chitinophagaceae bacterium]|nr:MFS transporter [Chitinophagaceae bacterium]
MQQVCLVAGMYPIVCGIGQLFTGKLGDIYCKKQLITAGMLLQAVALFIITITASFWVDIIAMVLPGAGTALLYPNFLNIIAENTHPHQRAQSMSIFRFWLDSGYVIGAVLSGIIAEQFGITAAFVAVAIKTATAGLLAEVRMCCTTKVFWKSQVC